MITRQTMAEIFTVSSVGERIFSHLSKTDLLNCRLICKTWKSILQEPIFWLHKLKQIGHPDTAHNKWLDLIQNSMKIDKPKGNLTLSLMLKFYKVPHPNDVIWKKVYLNLPPIHIATKYGQLEVVKLIHQFDKDCNRAISYRPASQDICRPLIIAIKNNQISVVEYMVENIEGIVEESIGMDNSNPLQYAIKKNNLEMVKILAPKTKNLNHQSRLGTTALHMATRRPEIFNYLMLNFGSKINANLTANHHRIPLHLVCNGTDFIPNRVEIVKSLVAITSNIDERDSFNKSPVHYAQENGYTEIVEILTEKLIDNFLNRVFNYPNTTDYNGRLLLHLVCMKNSFNFDINLEARNDLIVILMKLTSNINQQDSEGKTALHHATENGFSELVKTLAKSCDANIGNENGYLPIEMAILNNDVQIVEILAPVTKPFQLSGILQRPEVQEYSWKCIEILNQSNRKRRKSFVSKKPAKRARHFCY